MPCSLPLWQWYTARVIWENAFLVISVSAKSMTHSSHQLLLFLVQHQKGWGSGDGWVGVCMCVRG